MRIVILFTFFLTLFYWKSSATKENPIKVDTLKFKLGAPKRKQVVREVKKEFHPPELQREVTESSSSLKNTENDAEEEYSDSNSSEEYVDDNSGREISSEIEEVDESINQEEIPFDKAWNEEFGEVIQNLDPENAQEIFNAYVSERESYQQNLQELVKTEEENQDLETIISDLEVQHEDKLKEILGPHYELVKEHHTKFLENHSH